MSNARPLILVGNDDGIASPGLLALVAALRPLGEILICAPRVPFSSAGRSFVGGTPEFDPRPWPEDGVTAFAISGPPAYAVRCGLACLAPRAVDLVVSGINYGENLGSDTTLSGTVGAALESAVEGIPSLAVSLQAPPEYHHNPTLPLDFSYAAQFAHRLAQGVLRHGLPAGVDLVKVDLPTEAGPTTPWRQTRVSRQRYWRSLVGPNERGQRQIVGYEARVDLDTLERDSDIYAFYCEHAISVAPLSVDLSAQVGATALSALLE